MNRTNTLLYYSLLAAFVPTVSDAGIRVGNLSRSNAQAYQQVNEMRFNSAENTMAAIEATTAVNPIPAQLPIPVSNSELANKIMSGNTDSAVDMTHLQNCARIYPDGEFEWTRPTLGHGIGGASTCTSVVELRAVGAGLDGSDVVLARANLASGDSVRCNISEFPDATHLPLDIEITVPADNEPTMDDVIAVMNAEQKQNAGLKIAAGALIGGLGGNIAGKNEPGHEGLLGGGRAKTQGTIIGAVSGAALMAGNAYTGKVAGDTILSTGVNAAAGGVVGNMVASGDSVLRIEMCTVDGIKYKCLWGFVANTSSIDGSAYISSTNPNNFKVCDKSGTNCRNTELDITHATIAGYDTQDEQLKNRSTGQKMDINDIFLADGFQSATDKYCYLDGKMDVLSGECNDVWIKLSGTVSDIKSRVPAMVVDVEDKGFGWKKSDWNDFKSLYGYKEVVGRSGSGIATNLTMATGKTLLSGVNFIPVYLDSTDGGLIELGNKARLKGTLTGAGVGGAMGAFAGYQGAQSDIENRWVSAVREYKDSLQKVYCATGKRFLSYYNDTVIIPNTNE